MPASLPIRSVNHVARLTKHLDESRAFYRDVLGFRELKRPAFDFPGAWLFNCGLQIHLIVDERIGDSDGEISTRAGHLALHVDDIEAVEQLLGEHSIEYKKNFVPLTQITQLFFCDPDGHHVEIGTYPPIEGLEFA